MKYTMGTKGHKHVLKLLANVSKRIHARKKLRNQLRLLERVWQSGYGYFLNNLKNI
jgi:hypothetical protein